MPDTNLKLVDDLTDQELAEIESEMRSAQKRPAGNDGGPAVTVLPPNGDSEMRYDDLANSERFLEMYGDDLLYVVEAKKWLHWNSKHWEFDTTNQVFSLATRFAKYLYSPEICRDDVSFKHAKRSNMRTGINAMLELAQRRKACTMTSFDSNPNLLNCRNGTLDLRTGEMKSHSREDRITRLVDHDYDGESVSPTFERFLETIQPDPSIRAFLQRSVGYSLLGVVRERSFWILYGTGNNGKSVFVNLFNNLLCEYASATTTSSVMAGKQSAIPNDIARLKGKRFIIIPETEENERMNSALVKALSAGDKVTARFLFGEFFDFYFSGKLWIATNHKPMITDHSKGFWDRLKLIPFNEDIPKEKVIKSDDLMASLLAEANGILNWAVTGCRDYFDLDSLEVPEILQKEIDQYKYEQDSIMQFIELRCETIDKFQADFPDAYINETDFKANNTDVYKAYKQFCDDTGEYKHHQRRFTQKLRERGFTQMPIQGNRVWKGFRLRDV